MVEADILSVPLNLIEPQGNPNETSGGFNVDIGSKYPKPDAGLQTYNAY